MRFALPSADAIARRVYEHAIELPAPLLCARPHRTCDLDLPSQPACLFSCQIDATTALTGRGNHRSDAARKSLTQHTEAVPKVPE